MLNIYLDDEQIEEIVSVGNQIEDIIRETAHIEKAIAKAAADNAGKRIVEWLGGNMQDITSGETVEFTSNGKLLPDTYWQALKELALDKPPEKV